MNPCGFLNDRIGRTAVQMHTSSSIKKQSQHYGAPCRLSRPGQSRGGYWNRNASNLHANIFLDTKDLYTYNFSGCSHIQRAYHQPGQTLATRGQQNLCRKTRRNNRVITATHLSNVVDRLCCRIDDQGLILAARLDQIQRRIDLLDLAISDITPKKTCTGKEIETHEEMRQIPTDVPKGIPDVTEDVVGRIYMSLMTNHWKRTL